MSILSHSKDTEREGLQDKPAEIGEEVVGHERNSLSYGRVSTRAGSLGRR